MLWLGRKGLQNDTGDNYAGLGSAVKWTWSYNAGNIMYFTDMINTNRDTGSLTMFCVCPLLGLPENRGVLKHLHGMWSYT